MSASDWAWTAYLLAGLCWAAVIVHRGMDQDRFDRRERWLARWGAPTAADVPASWRASLFFAGLYIGAVIHTAIWLVTAPMAVWHWWLCSTCRAERAGTGWGHAPSFVRRARRAAGWQGHIDEPPGSGPPR